MARSAPLWAPFARPRVPNNGAQEASVLANKNSIPSVVCVVGRIRRASKLNNKVGGEQHLHRGVSTAAMAENLKDLRLEDGTDGAAAAASDDKVR